MKSKLKCPHCNHEQISVSKLSMVTCSSCQKKFRRQENTAPTSKPRIKHNLTKQYECPYAPSTKCPYFKDKDKSWPIRNGNRKHRTFSLLPAAKLKDYGTRKILLAALIHGAPRDPGTRCFCFMAFTRMFIRPAFTICNPEDVLLMFRKIFTRWRHLVSERCSGPASIGHEKNIED